MFDNESDIYQHIGQAMFNALPDEWESAYFNCYLLGENGSYKAHEGYFFNSEHHDFNVDEIEYSHCFDAFGCLYKLMKKDESDVPWNKARFELKPDGSFDIQFKYDEDFAWRCNVHIDSPAYECLSSDDWSLIGSWDGLPEDFDRYWLRYSPLPLLVVSNELPLQDNQSHPLILKNILNEIKGWIADKTSESIFNEAADFQDIQKLEAYLEREVPNELIELLLCCNGEVDHSTGFMSYIKLMNIDEIIDDLKLIDDKNYPIPLTDDGGGNSYCLMGNGTVIFSDHEDPYNVEVIANNLTSFFADFLGDLKKGKYVISKEQNCVGLIELYDVFSMTDPDIYNLDINMVHKKYRQEKWDEYA